ncbi:MAG: S-adenosylmethionine:tRNA ribosyltransferase-isomerase [Polyangiaceae bacterium]
MNALLERSVSGHLPELLTQRLPRPNGVGSVIYVNAEGASRLLPEGQLATLLPKATLWVLNDAAVLPAALWVEVEGSGTRIEIRIASLNDESGTFSAIGFGSGNYQVQTEQRGAVQQLPVGAWLRSAASVRFEVVHQTGRLFELRCAGGYRGLLHALYTSGAPIQYAYTARPHQLREVQNSYVGRPWAIEPASAGRHLSASVLSALQAAGQQLAWLTHAAGISSTGDAALDALLPFPERYEIPEATAVAVAAARERGSLVVAVGSSTTRALEAAASPGGALQSGSGLASLRLHADYEPQVVDVLLTGIHEAGSSHRELTRAFASDGALDAAWHLAAAHDLKLHEFGDAMLIRRR